MAAVAEIFSGAVSCFCAFLYILLSFNARVFTRFNSFSCTYSSSIPLKSLICRGFMFIQQALVR
jgi:hypothetical protein